MPHVEFVNDGPAAETPSGTTLLAAARVRGVRIGSACGGEGSCSTCRVEVLAGAAHLSPINPNEVAYCLGSTERLACQARVFGDVVVRVLEIPPADLEV